MKRRLLIALSLACVLLVSTASAAAPNWDVSGAWEGRSGLVSNLVYYFDMDLTQGDGNVTGSIVYEGGAPFGTITGFVSGDEFYFTRNDPGGYWATCWPCTISADGTYFHGYGTGPGQEVEWEAWRVVVPVMIDIKPGSCPNPLNTKSKGVLPVAVLGTDDFDVTTIDPATIRLTREGNEVGVSPLRWSYEDVATPFEGELCECHDLNGDGYLDLTLKFSSQEVTDTLDLEGEAGNTIPLFLTGSLTEEADGTPIDGSDCVWVLGTGEE